MMARVFRLGDGISTDAIIPGRYNVGADRAALGRACLIEARPDLAEAVRPGDVIVAGRNFGCGSSREHAPIAIQAAGFSVVIARSFARIFYRNAVNIGLPVITCDELWGAVTEGDEITVELRQGILTAGDRRFQGDAPSPVALRIIEAGSLVELIRTHGWGAIEEAVA
jgi:3-isopropylmalate dehydratase small subunit